MSSGGGANLKDGAGKRIRIGELWIDALTFEEALAEVERLVRGGHGGAVFTPNIDHVVNSEEDAALRSAYTRVTLAVPDGQPLVWASRALGTPLPEKISGSDLVPRLLILAREKKWRVFLLGGGPGVPEKAAKALAAEGVLCVGAEGPRVGVEPREDEQALIGRVREAKAELVLVGLGSPKQERFIDRAAPELSPALLFGIGASLDFLAGTMKRAPRWMSDSGLEWLYRLAQEPRRLGRRYLLNDPRFALIFFKMLRAPRATRLKDR